MVTWHLNVVLLALLGTYISRDIFPLVMIDQQPLDGDQGIVLWAKFAVLTCAGVGIPLMIPRKYVPVDPKVRIACRSRPSNTNHWLAEPFAGPEPRTNGFYPFFSTLQLHGTVNLFLSPTQYLQWKTSAVG
jgi:hypothetical protein